MPRRKSDGSQSDAEAHAAAQDATRATRAELPLGGAESEAPEASPGTPEAQAAGEPAVTEPIVTETVAVDVDAAAGAGEDPTADDARAEAHRAEAEADREWFGGEAAAEAMTPAEDAIIAKAEETRPALATAPADPEAVAAGRVETERAEEKADREWFGGSEPSAGASVAAPPVPPAPEAVADADDGDEGGHSVAAWVLGILLLLLAGAALGIWGAPKLAPRLPAGMKPVADWLAPGSSATEDEIATLRADVEGRIADLDARVGALPSPADIDTRIGAQVSPLASQLAGDVTALKASIGQIDGADTRARLDKLESALQGQAAELGTLKEQLAGAAGAASAATAEKIDVYRAELDGVRATVGSLQDQVGALAARIDEVGKSAEARVAAAESKATETAAQAATALSAAEANAQVALIRAAVASGAPYAEPLGLLQSRGVAVPAGLEAGAASGVESLAALRDSFPDAAHEAIKASIMASAGNGVVARARAYVRAQVASRSLTPQVGAGTDAVLSRMEDKLRHDDLAGALEEAKALPSEAAAAMAGWLDAARLRAEAIDGMAALAAPQPAAGN